MRRLLWLGCCLLLLVGCEDKFQSSQSAKTVAVQSGQVSGREAPPNSVFSSNVDSQQGSFVGSISSPNIRSLNSALSTPSFAATDSKGPSTTAQQSSVLPADPDRKIIYVADVSLVVQDFSRTEKELPALVRQAGGYLADVSIDRSRGQQLSGRWMVRVPVDRFEALLDSLSTLGVPESRHQTAQDISEEYVDLEARIKNSKRLEERILKLVDERTGNIKDVAEAEQQLARIREEIERMEGRLRYLANRAALTTVTINAREEHDYKPPETPAFSSRLNQSWRGSVVALQDSSENFLVNAVSAAPWIGIWAVILSPVLLFGRNRYKRFSRARQGGQTAANQTQGSTQA
jgi:uncharacterized coiled-coil protein SlyX